MDERPSLDDTPILDLLSSTGRYERRTISDLLEATHGIRTVGDLRRFMDDTDLTVIPGLGQRRANLLRRALIRLETGTAHRDRDGATRPRHSVAEVALDAARVAADVEPFDARINWTSRPATVTVVYRHGDAPADLNA